MRPGTSVTETSTSMETGRVSVAPLIDQEIDQLEVPPLLEGTDDLSTQDASRRAFLAAVVATGICWESTKQPAEAATTTMSPTNGPDWKAILKKSSKRALGGGKAGAAAAVVQVCCYCTRTGQCRCKKIREVPKI